MNAGPAQAEVLGAIIVGAVAAAFILRVALKPPVRREIRAHPWIAAVGAVLAVGAVWLCAQPLWASDAARRTALTALAGITGFAWVRARPGYGARRGWPPGSLGLATSLDAVEDPDFYARSADRWGPVFKMSQIHRPVVCITDLPLGLDLFTASESALGRSDWAFNRLVPGGYLEYMEGPDHARYRGLLEASLTATAVRSGGRAAEEAATEQLERMSRAGGEAGVHPEPFLLPVPQRGLLKTFLGVDSTDPDFDEFREPFVALNRPMELFLPAPRHSRRSYATLVALVRRRATALASDGAPGPEDSVLRRLVDMDPALVDDDALVGNLVLMVKEGSIMVRGLLRWLVKMLADHPEWIDRIRSAEGDPETADRMCRAFVRETIRLYESRYVYRRTLRPVEVGGHVIPAGWLVRLCTGEAHENPEAYERPRTFDPGRFLDSVPTTERFCPFGHGTRDCLGQQPALAISAAFVRRLALAYDVAGLDDGPAWRINRHWGLWRPSLRLRVRLTPRGDSA